MAAYELKRDVTRKECSWLKRDYKKGEIVVEFHGFTYGCIGDGVAIYCDDKESFTELPEDALNRIT